MEQANFMSSDLVIRNLEESDIQKVTYWAAQEGFSPGLGDVNIYKNTDRQGLWIGSLNSNPIGCIAGVKYNLDYGFIGLFIVDKEYRGLGYGLQLWKHVMNNLHNVSCLGIEAAPDRLADYHSWGFNPSSITTRWEVLNSRNIQLLSNSYSFNNEYSLLEDSNIPPDIIQKYDENKENTPRPHFLSDWLSNKSGKVLAIVNKLGICLGFCRIRPCLLKEGTGFRIGPLIADTPFLATLLLNNLINSYPGKILIDSPGANLNANKLFRSLGFSQISHTIRMYKGKQPVISMNEIYGLACLELG